MREVEAPFGFCQADIGLQVDDVSHGAIGDRGVNGASTTVFVYCGPCDIHTELAGRVTEMGVQTWVARRCLSARHRIESGELEPTLLDEGFAEDAKSALAVANGKVDSAG